MNFQKHYFREEKLEEKITDVIADIGSASPGTTAKAAAKGVGRGIANIARGALGRTKEMAFEPNWLKVLKPIDVRLYKQTINKYSNWRNQKTLLGPKKKYSVKDLRNGVLGDFSGDEFINILSKYDSSMKQVNMDAEIKPSISIYLLNNGGKVIMMQLPVGPDGKKKKFAMGLDAKAERAFRLIHGQTFDDYSLKTEDEAEKTEEKNVADQTPHKYEIDDAEFEQMAPDEGETFQKFDLKASNESFSLFDMFTEEVLSEKKTAKDKKRNLTKIDDKWYNIVNVKDGKPTKDAFAVTSVGPNDSAVTPDKKEDKELEKELADILDNGGQIKYEETSEEMKANANDEKQKEEIKKNKKEYDKVDIKNYGELALDLKDELLRVPNKVKPDKDSKMQYGWRYLTKNGGTIFVYQSKEDGKNYIKYDDKAQEVVKKLKLIPKYGMEKAVKPE